MFSFVLVIHLIIVILMVGLILLQKSEAGGLVASGNMGGMMSVRGSTNFMTRTTAILAGSFFVTSITLVVLASHSRSHSSSLLDKDPLAVSQPVQPDVPVGGAQSKTVEAAPVAPAPQGDQKAATAPTDSKAPAKKAA